LNLKLYKAIISPKHKMEIKVLEESKTKLVFEIQGEDHTLCNSLTKELNNDESVKTATYNIEHPSIGIPRIIVETAKKTPREAIADALKRLKKDNTSFLKAFQKEIKS